MKQIKIAEGVTLHLLKTNRFKTNHLTCRFSGNGDEKRVARRVLVAQMLETANATYPTIQAFRERLAELYGVNLSTSVSMKGLTHIVDIDITFIRDQYTFNQEPVLESIIHFLRDILFSPLVSVVQYQPRMFHREKENLIKSLESDLEDVFLDSEMGLRQLLFTEKVLQNGEYSQSEFLARENSYTAYQEFQRMLVDDQLDIFLVGYFDDYSVVQQFHHYPLQDRPFIKQRFHQVTSSNVVNERVVSKHNCQSVLQLGYVVADSNKTIPLVAFQLLNAMLGAYPHSRLFEVVREKAGLAYHVGSVFDSSLGYLQIYAGIDAKERNHAIRLITKELTLLKLGRFSLKLLQVTKEILLADAERFYEYPKQMIEWCYNETYRKGKAIEIWKEEIESLSKEHIMEAARHLRLQAIYFLEGD